MHTLSRIRRTLSAGVIASLGFVAACSDSTAPPKAVTIVFLGDANQSGTVGAVLTPGPTIQIRDDKGNPLAGRAFTVTVNGGGTLVGAPTKTVSGTTALGTWTLGTTAGTQTIVVQSSGLPALTISAKATAAAASVSTSGGIPTTSSGRVGQVAAPQPQIKLLDAFGNIVVGAAVTVQITGGGSVQNANPVTDASGIASAGAWTFGTVAGTQRVTLSAGALVAPIVYTATVEAGAAANVAAVGTTSTVATAGTLAPISPTVVVTDAFGNGVAGLPVAVALAAGSGSVTNPSPVTDASGTASVGLWTLGAGGGLQTVTLTAPGFAPLVFSVTATVNLYTVTVRFLGGIPSAPVQAAFLNAAARIQQVIVGDVADIPVTGFDVSGCFDAPWPGGPAVIPPLTETLDDIIIYARVSPIDGQSGILGVGGPCFIRNASGLPIIGRMQFDDADVASMIASGIFGNVVLHEMLHAIGIGSLWQPGAPFAALSQGILGANPIFLGAQARAAFVAAGGTTPSGTPIENVGQTGTRDSHWRQSNLFVNELMTGTIFGATRPFSAITMAALGDFGYQVSLATAEAFAIQPPGALRSISANVTPIVLQEPEAAPLFTIDERGNVGRLRSLLRAPIRR